MEANNVHITAHSLEKCLELASVRVQANVEGADGELVREHLVKVHTGLALVLLEATVLMGRAGMSKLAIAISL